MAGPVVERLFGGDTQLTVLGYRWTGLGPSGLGFDGTLGFAPQGLAAGTLIIQADAGVVQSISAGPIRLLLGGGLTHIVQLKRSFEFYPGLQARVALLVPVEARLAVRVDLTRRLYLAAGETYPFWSLGFSLPAVARR
jgi:hypothetical protein